MLHDGWTAHADWWAAEFTRTRGHEPSSVSMEGTNALRPWSGAQHDKRVTCHGGT